MLKNRSIAFKLTFFILSSTLLIGAFMFTYNYLFSKKIIEKQIKQNAINLTSSVVNRIDAILLPLEEIPQNLAIFLENSNYTEKELTTLLRKIVKNNPDIQSCTVAFAPNKFYKDKTYFAPYCYKSNGKIKLKYIGGDSYRYFYLDWYQLPKELKKPIWSEPFYAKGTETVMATYSVPFYKNTNGKRNFVGVVSVGISLDWLQKIVKSIKVGNTGYAFLISSDGRFITHPNKRLIMNETIFTVAKELNMPFLKKIGKDMINGKKGFIQTRSILTHKECWLSFSPLSSNGWALGVMFPKKELTADVTSLSKHVLFIAIVGFVLLVVVIIIISRSITKPLIALTDTTKNVAKGNLDIEIPYTDLEDEVGKLAQSFEFMKKSLKAYIKNLQKTTAEKERIKSELNIAAKIQISMLPRTFPPFPDREEFDIYATMKPAKEVGGDFYDFFFVDNSKLCFLIGDVSGKGVPAALFMAIMKYLLKTEAVRGLNPADILKRINAIIHPDNETCMFATIFLGILDLDSYTLEFSNAAHNPPILCKKNGDVEFLNVPTGLVVGVMDDALFENRQIKLQKDDILFLYTDGVTEAMDKDGNMFSNQKLKETLEFYINTSPNAQSLIKAVKKEIKKFTKDAEQSDDITMLALKIK